MDINTGKTLSKEDSLKQSIKLVLLTLKGERILNRNFGSSIVSYLGMPVNSVVMKINAEVISSVQKDDSRILVDKVVITNNNNSGLNIYVTYNGKGEVNVTA